MTSNADIHSLKGQQTANRWGYAQTTRDDYTYGSKDYDFNEELRRAYIGLAHGLDAGETDQGFANTFKL